MNVEEESLDENILRQIQQAEKIAKSMGGDMTGAIKGIEKIRRGLSHHKRVKVALKKANESVNESISVFDVDFYKDNSSGQTSHKEIIRGDKFSDVISKTTKVAKSKKMNYVELYYKGAFIGSIDKRNSFKFKKGRNHQKSPLSVNETPEELGGMKMYSKADALKKVNSMQKTAGAKIYKVEKVKAKLYGKPATMYNLYTKNKNHSTNQNPYGLPMMKGVYIVPVQEALNVMPGRSGINADEHEIKDFLLKAMKMSGIKVLKYKPMKKGLIGNDVWGGFYTVKSSNKSDVLPLYIQRSGKINLGVASKEFIIGKIGDLSKVVKNLKDFKKTDLDL